MSLGFWQIAIIIVLMVLMFGRGKISELMGDVAKGIKSFQKGMKDDAADSTDESGKTINHDAQETVSKTKTRDEAVNG